MIGRFFGNVAKIPLDCNTMMVCKLMYFNYSFTGMEANDLGRLGCSTITSNREPLRSLLRHDCGCRVLR